MIAQDLAAHLGGLGYEVVAVIDNGADAVEKCLALRPDIALLDINVPGDMDGVEVAAHLRNKADIPAVFLTAHSDDATLARAGCSTPFGFILKPFEARELRVAVEIGLYRHRAERQSRMFEKWLANTVKQIADAMIVTGDDGRILFINSIAEGLTGLPAADAAGRNIRDVLPLSGKGGPDVLTAVFARDEKQTWPLVYFGMRCKLDDSAGGEMAIDLSITPNRDADGSEDGFIFLFRPAAADRQTSKDAMAERVLQTAKLESIGTVAGGFAHHFNNLACAILGNIQLCRLSLDRPDDCLKLIADTEIAARRSAELCDQLITFAGTRQHRGGKTDLRAFLDEGHHWFDSSIPDHIRFSVRVEGGPSPLPVPIRETHLFTIIKHLISNSVEAIGNRTGSITISAGVRACDRSFLDGLIAGETIEEGNYATITVEDDGTGIAPAVRQRIFDPFFSTRVTGRGMGLSESIGIVRGYRGTLHVESDPGRSTSVSVLLPTIPDHADNHKKACNDGTDDRWTGNGRVLLIVDDILVRKPIVRFLEDLGFSVAEASDGNEIDRFVDFDKRRASLVISQLSLPGLGGVGVLRHVKRCAPQIPVILIGNDSQQRVKERFSDEPFDDYLAMPFEPGTLRTALKNVHQAQQNSGALVHA